MTDGQNVFYAAARVCFQRDHGGRKYKKSLCNFHESMNVCWRGLSFLMTLSWVVKHERMMMYIFFICTLLSLLGNSGRLILVKNTAAARAAIPSPTSACWVFTCFRNPLNSDMDYMVIFNVRTCTGVGQFCRLGCKSAGASLSLFLSFFLSFCVPP